MVLDIENWGDWGIMFTQGKTKALFYNYSLLMTYGGGGAQYYASCKLILYIVIVALDFSLEGCRYWQYDQYWSIEKSPLVTLNNRKLPIQPPSPHQTKISNKRQFIFLYPPHIFVVCSLIKSKERYSRTQMVLNISMFRKQNLNRTKPWKVLTLNIGNECYFQSRYTFKHKKWIR